MKSLKRLLAITIALLPSAVLAEQFTPQQMLDVMTKSPGNRDVRVQDGLWFNCNNVEGECTDSNHNKWINTFKPPVL